MSTPQRFSWFAVHVRTKYEERVADFLEGQGYEFFLPRHTCRKQWSDRIKTIETALFPGYVFCKFDPLDRLPILKTPGVIQIAGYHRVPVPVEESEIAAIQALVSSGLPNQPWPYLQVGERVRIGAGALQGHEGILIEFRGSHRLVLSVTLLQRAVAVEIDSASVESMRRIAKPEERSQGLPVAVYNQDEELSFLVR